MDQKHTISIGFSKRKGFNLISKLISFVEGTEFSHTFVSWKCTNIDRRKVYEAVGSGSRKISNHKFKEKAYITDIFQFEVDAKTLFKIDQFTHDESGTPYGYKHLVGLLIMRVKNAFWKMIGSKRRSGNPLKDKRYSQICVEAGAYVMQEAGIEIPGNVENYGLREFYDFVEEHGKKLDQMKIDSINKG